MIKKEDDMLDLLGYTIKEQLEEGQQFGIFRGQRDIDGVQVIIKLLTNEYPTEDQLAKFRYEYEISRKLNGDGTVNVLALEKYQNGLAIIFEDIKAFSLKKV